jgi:hypothetical protein
MLTFSRQNLLLVPSTNSRYTSSVDAPPPPPPNPLPPPLPRPVPQMAQYAAWDELKNLSGTRLREALAVVIAIRR